MSEHKEIEIEVTNYDLMVAFKDLARCYDRFTKSVGNTNTTELLDNLDDIRLYANEILDLAKYYIKNIEKKEWKNERNE